VATVIIADHVSKHYVLHHARPLTVKERALAFARRRAIARAETFCALEDVSFTVASGESVALVGRNGSGKSTLLKLIAGIYQPSAGRVLVDARTRMASMIELGVGFHPELTGVENVYLSAAIHGLKRHEIDAIYPQVVEFAELARFMDSPLKTYSSGMVMRLGFAICVQLNPDVLLLDEIFAVGDESFQRKCVAAMRDFQERGKTMFFVSHSADTVRDMCGRAVVLEHGRLQFDGNVDAAIRTYRRILGEEPSLEGADPHRQKSPAERAAEGREEGWHRRLAGGLFETAGALHLEFLRAHGLRPTHHVLDLGCGSLRSGVPLLRYLEPGHYVGVDHDGAVLEAGITLELAAAGIDPARGHYYVSGSADLSNVHGPFDVIWCSGLLQDLPHELVAMTFAAAVRKLAPTGQMFVAYFEASEFLSLAPIARPGPSLSYFDHAPRHFDFATLARYAEAAGGHAQRIGEWNDPHGQSMLVITKRETGQG
jgi:ABC-2 type transport system ATP-binding protein